MTNVPAVVVPPVKGEIGVNKAERPSPQALRHDRAYKRTKAIEEAMAEIKATRELEEKDDE